MGFACTLIWYHTFLKEREKYRQGPEINKNIKPLQPFVLGTHSSYLYHIE